VTVRRQDCTFIGGARERATLCAALSLYQTHLEAGILPQDAADIAASCDGRPPLDSDEIAVLLQEISE
jgi:hypothetical protein